MAAFLEIKVALPVETGCTDYPGSTQAFTWLNQDVRNWATSTLRVTADSRRWSVMSWSTRGYCAALLHLPDPERFGAAASVGDTSLPGGREHRQTWASSSSNTRPSPKRAPHSGGRAPTSAVGAPARDELGH